jgi:RHS repeat-associated protein
VTDPAGGQTQFTYDLNDNVTQVKDALNRISTMSYDVSNQLTSSTNPRGDQELYTYTVLGQLKTVRNGRLKTRSYQYTDRGELKYMYLPDGTTEFYEYAGDGNVSAFRGSGRNKISYQYDNIGRLSVIDYPNMTDTTFTYDSAGRRISMTDTSGQTSWFYDDAGRLTSLNQAGKVTSYTYNLDGSRATMTQPAGTTTYTYDQYGRFQSLKNPFDEVTAIGYDQYSRVAQKQQIAPGNLNPFTTEFFSYDVLDRLSVKSTMKISTNVEISAESYNYNAVSEVLSHTVDGETTSYGYDAASQLTSEMRPGYSASYTFDGNGNRLSKAVNGVTEFYSYDDGDKLLSAGVKTYTYDLAGRTTSVKVGMGAPSVLTYDDEDRLKTFMGQTYTYNGFDTRVAKNAGGSVTAYHRDGSGVTAPLISDSGATYTPGVSERRNGVSTFLNAGLKDIAKQTDISGNVTAIRKYDAYGMVIGSTGTWKGPFGYSGSAGYQEDETGLQLLGHRYYDSSTGRFITRDPIKDGRNWYVYCDGNPVSRVDANGLDWHNPGIVEVSPEFGGSVWALGEPDKSWGEKQTVVNVPRGHVTSSKMDCDVVMIVYPSGRVRMFFLMGSKNKKLEQAKKKVGLIEDENSSQNFYVDKNGDVHGPGVFEILDESLSPLRYDWSKDWNKGLRNPCPPNRRPKPAPCYAPGYEPDNCIPKRPRGYSGSDLYTPAKNTGS